MLLLGPGVAGAAQREAELWTLSVNLSQAFTDNLLLIGVNGPGDAITNASLRLSYIHLNGSSSLSASGWLGAQRFNRFSAYSGPQFGLNASSGLAFGPRARMRLYGSFADGLNFASLGSAQVGLPQTNVQSGSASAGLSYRMAPDTSVDALLDASAIRYRADALFDTSRLLGDTFVPPDLLAATPPPGLGVNEAPALDEGLVALSLLASEGLRTLRLDFGSWRASAGIAHDFSPRTRLTFGGGYRQTYQSPSAFPAGNQTEGQVALKQVVDPTANLSLSYGYQESRFGIGVTTHSFTVQADKELGKKVRLDASVGESHLEGPDRPSSGWTLIGGAGFTARLRRSSLSARYGRSRYQGLITGRSEVADSVYAGLGHVISKRVSLSGYGSYRTARDQLQRQYSYGATVLGAALNVRIKRRVSAGASYSFLRFHTQNTRSADRSMVSLHVGYARVLK